MDRGVGGITRLVSRWPNSTPLLVVLFFLGPYRSRVVEGQRSSTSRVPSIIGVSAEQECAPDVQRPTNRKASTVPGWVIITALQSLDLFGDSREHLKPIGTAPRTGGSRKAAQIRAR
ncbi:hypothetical protein BJX64DRAFT_184443 [Aspergillus heterothallicus]